MPRVNLIARATRGAATLALVGCTSLSPQLPPPDFARLERLETRADREAAYREHELQVRNELVGTRYTLGTTPNQIPRPWTSLERVLQSNADSAAALPEKKRRRARVLTVLAGITGLTFVAGVGASAAEGFEIGKPTPGNVIMLSSSVATLAFALSAGLVWNSMQDDYERAAEIYNRSLGLRLGIYDANGRYLPPAGSLIEPDGSIVMFDQLQPPRPTGDASGDAGPQGAPAGGERGAADAAAGEGRGGGDASGSENTQPEATGEPPMIRPSVQPVVPAAATLAPRRGVAPEGPRRLDEP